MKCLLIVFAIGLSLASNDFCNLKPETGMCRGRMSRFYYNPASARCDGFIYGGCKGNQNNFKDLAECLATCAVRKPAECSDKPTETGPCRAKFLRYRYNVEANKCERFIYGGCGQSKNFFLAQEDCLQTCKAGGVVE